MKQTTLTLMQYYKVKVLSMLNAMAEVISKNIYKLKFFSLIYIQVSKAKWTRIDVNWFQPLSVIYSILKQECWMLFNE